MAGAAQAVIAGAKTPTIQNISAAVAGTEYNAALPDGTKMFIIRARNHSAFEFYFTAAATDTINVPAGSSYFQQGLTTVGLTVYFKAANNSEEFEILSWV